MVAKAKSDLAALAAAIDWRSYGSTVFQADRIQRVIALLAQHDGGLDAVQIAARLPANPRTKEPVSPQTVQAALRVPVAEGALRVNRRYLGRYRDERKSCRDLDVYEPIAEGLRGMRQAKPLRESAPGKRRRFEGVDWPKVGITHERGESIARLCLSIDAHPKLTIDQRARELGIGHATLKRLIDICGPPEQSPKADSRLDLVETEENKATWPRAASIRRVKWQNVTTLPRVRGHAPAPDMLRTLPVGERPAKTVRLDRERLAIVKTRDFMAADGIETVDQANAAIQIIATIGDVWDQGLSALAAELNIARSTLEKHLTRLRKAGLVSVPPHRCGLRHNPITVEHETVAGLPDLPGTGRSKIATRRKPPAAANGNGKAPAEETPAEAPKKPGPDATYGHLKEWLADEVRAGRDGGPTEMRERYRENYPHGPMPSKSSRSLDSFLSKARGIVRKERATVSPD